MYFLNKIIKAFSLTELMIVVAIAAFITAIAIPNYKTYVNKARVTNMISTIDPCQTQVYQTFLQTASFPATVTCYGQSITGTMTTTALKGNVQAAYTTGSSAGGTYAQFQVQSNDVVASGTTPANLYIRMYQTASTAYGGGDLKYCCGTLSTDVRSVSAKYLPAGCNVVVDNVDC